MGTHYRTCPLCEAMCGLEIETSGDEVVRVRGDRDDVWSKGFLCPKGATIGQLHADPDRLRAPMVRDRASGTWREVSWGEAFRRCEELLHGVVERHGIGSVHAYLGNPNAHSYSLTRYSGAVIGVAGVTNIWSAGTVDQWPKNLVCAQLYGGAWTIPIPDVAHTDLFVIMGANPQASNGSILSFPDLIGELARLRERGGRAVVIDPRRTGTADKADEWIGIRPGTDAALLLAVVHELDATGAVRSQLPRVLGVDEVLAAARRYPPARVADWCGVPAARIEALAAQLASAERPVVYGRIGLCNQAFGTLASWLVEVVNVLLGRLDAVGGARFPRPALSLIAETSRRRGPVRTGRWRSRVRGVPEVMGQFPLACLAEEIDTPGDGQVKALLTVAGNPVLSAPDAGRLDAALPLLDAMVSIDNYLNETTRHADVILPGLSPLEQPHCDEPIWGFALRAVARWSPAVFDMGERPDEWEVCLLLGSILAGMRYDDVDVAAMDDAYFAGRASRHGVDPGVVADPSLRGPDRIVDLTYRVAPFGLTLEEVRRYPHGLDLGESHAPLDDVLRTDSGDVELAHDLFFDDLARLDAAMAAPTPDLVLIGRRHVRSNNSWMHNLPGLMKGRDRSGLLIHPADAERLGVAQGSKVRLRTEAGEVESVAELTDELVPGVVSLPHGWGHGMPGARLSVAAKHPGANTNVLIPATAVDVPSNNAAVNGVPVEVTAL